MIFENRADAGRQLSKQLQGFGNQQDVVVLGIPQGGVVVAFEIASALLWTSFCRESSAFPTTKNFPSAPSPLATDGISIIHFDETRSAEPLEPIGEFAFGEPAETSPSDV
jgi:hypothetical protein